MRFAEWLELVREYDLFYQARAARWEMHGPKPRRPREKNGHLADAVAEPLESRVLMSAANPIATPPIEYIRSLSGGYGPAIVPDVSAPFGPSDIQGAYGINAISFGGTAGTGAGQTIAIIDAYNDPNIIADTATFSTRFGLPQFNTTGNPGLTVLNQTGGTSLPANATTGNWDLEISLDVQWAHAIAPMANIILFESSSASSSGLFAAAMTAANYTGVSVVSMSFGSAEFSGENNYDTEFTTPSGHQGVTFLASTGDSGAPAEYPAYSPNVVAVGGTSLSIDSDGSYGSESAWSGGGGGVSSYESQPGFQSGKVNGLSSTKRTAPDVSMLASPSTGVYVYDSWASGANNGGYDLVGGTSLACPMWAGLIAIANQGRVINGFGTLDGPSQTLPTLYQLSNSNFHDITTGNNGFAAGTGYDLATGLGTPIANLLMPAMVAAAQSSSATHLAFSTNPSSATAGAGISPSITVRVLDSSGNVVSSDSSNVTISIGTNAGGGTLSGTLTVAAVNGIATFSGLSLNKSGAGYTLVATDGSLTSATSSTFTISAAAASKIITTNQPAAGTVGVAISPAVTFAVEDTYGNICTGNSSTVTLTLSSGTFNGGSTTTSGVAVNGVVTFSNLVLATAGTFTLVASESGLTSMTTNSFTISKATPNVIAIDLGGIYNGLVFSVTSATASDANTSATIVSFGSGLLSYAYYAGTLTTPQQIAAATPLGSAPKNAGAYTVVASFAGNANYLAASSAGVNFTISQRTLHVTATGQNRIYNNATADTVTLSDDRVAGDALTLSDTAATFTSKDVGNSITVNVTGITASGSSAANYTLASTSATTSSNITPLTITGSITAADKVYDQTSAATISGRFLSGVLGSDTVSLVGGTGVFNSADVTTANTVTATGLSLSGAQASDYTLSNSTEAATAQITVLGIAGSITASGKVYDGTTAATIASRSLTGVLSGDSVSLIGGSATFNSKDVTSATTVTATGLSLSGAKASDYSLSNSTETASASITPLSISGSITSNTKVYDGTNSATVATRTLAGVVSGDTVSLVGGTATYNSKDVFTAATVTATGLSLTGAQAADYTLSNTTETATGAITPLGIAGSFTANNKVYDGTTSATVATRSLATVLSGDTVTLNGGVAVFNSKDVATATAVVLSGLTLSGAQAADYLLSNPNETAAASITPTAITGTITASNKVYDGTTSASIGTRTLTGVLGGDSVTLIGGSATFNSKDVTGATTVTATGLSLTGAQASNYSLSNSTETASASISPLAITASITASNKVYNASVAATIATRSLTGVVSGDTVSLVGGTATFNSQDVLGATTVTATGMSLTGASAGDYTLSNSTATASASITPASITGSIVAIAKTYDRSTGATFSSSTMTGLFSGDVAYVSGGAATFNSRDVAIATTITATGLTLAGAQATDYTLSNTTETAAGSITPAGVTAIISAAGKTYDGTTAATLTGETLSGVFSGDTVTVSGGSAVFDTKDAGSRTVTASGLVLGGAQVGNYTLGNVHPTATAVIAPLAITGSLLTADKSYDRTTNASIDGLSLTGTLNGDSVWGAGGTANFASKDVGTGITVTAVNLGLGGPAASDYTLSNPTETAVATISPLTVTASIVAVNKTYDGTTAATLTAETLNGIIPGDDVSLVNSAVPTFDSSDVPTASTVTMTGLSLTGADAGDYILANPAVSTPASVLPLGITGSVTASDKFYDGNRNAALKTRSLAGTLGTDDVSLAGGAALFASATVGKSKPVAVTGLALTGAQAADYVLLNPSESTTASIKALVIFGRVSNHTVTAGVQAAAVTTSDVQFTDPGLAGRIVTLQMVGHGTQGQKTTKTDANGEFTFSDLMPGTYTVKVNLPAHWRYTTANATGQRVTLQPGASADPILFGQTNAATVSGSVFLDANKDGKRQAREGGLSAWQVNLIPAGSSVATETAITDAKGNYTFSDVPIGNYQLSSVELTGYSPTTKAKKPYALVLAAGKVVTGMNFGQQFGTSAKPSRPRRAA